MKLLILSDLHLEHHAFDVAPGGERIDAHADAVVLAGDINEGLEGLRWARLSFPDKRIIYVAGNHEYYRQEWPRHLSDMRALAAELGIDFLERDSVVIDGVRFLGATLWTDFLLHGPEQMKPSMHMASARMNDYSLIRLPKSPKDYAPYYSYHSKKLVPQLTLEQHQMAVQWLQRELPSAPSMRTVVVTHHAPHPRSMPAGSLGDMLAPVYASDLEALMGQAAVWIHGHVHDSFDYELHGTRIISNPRGYPHRKGRSAHGVNDNFVADRVITV